MVCAVRWTTSSGTTATTFGSARRSRFCCGSSLAEKPRNVLAKLRSALMPSRLRTFATTEAVSVSARSMTMNRPVASGAPSGAGWAWASAGAGSRLGSGSAGTGVAAGASLGTGSALGIGSVLATGSALGIGFCARDGLCARVRRWFRARSRLRERCRGRLRRWVRGRFRGSRRRDDREGQEHGEEQGRDPSVHAHQCARDGRRRLRHLGPTGTRHGVRGPYSPIHPYPPCVRRGQRPTTMASTLITG